MDPARAWEQIDEKIQRQLGQQAFADAVTTAIRGYGPEILGFLVATQRDASGASEIFSQFCEDLWTGVRHYRGESSFRTWAYVLARNAAHRYRRDPYRKRGEALSAHPSLSQVADEVRTTTLLHLRSEVREKVTRLRDQLDPDDQALLILRVDRQMGWTAVARVLEGLGADDEALHKRTVTIRKRFERIKERLRVLATKEGLVSGER